MKEGGLEEVSVCEASVAASAPGVGSAHAFLLHVQVEPLEDTLASMESVLIGICSHEKHYIVGYVGFMQCHNDFPLPKVRQAIAVIRSTLACLNSRPETYLERSICEFEDGYGAI